MYRLSTVMRSVCYQRICTRQNAKDVKFQNIGAKLVQDNNTHEEAGDGRPTLTVAVEIRKGIASMKSQIYTSGQKRFYCRFIGSNEINETEQENERKVIEYFENSKPSYRVDYKKLTKEELLVCLSLEKQNHKETKKEAMEYLGRAIAAERDLTAKAQTCQKLRKYRDLLLQREEIKKHLVQSGLWRAYKKRGKTWQNLFPKEIQDEIVNILKEADQYAAHPWSEDDNDIED